MKCESCKDPIRKWQKVKTRIDHEGKEKKYHKGCFELLLDKIVDTVKANV